MAPEVSIVPAGPQRGRQHLGDRGRDRAGDGARRRYEIVFVDDGSRDGTLAAIRDAARDPAIRYLSFTRNFGHQAALRAGLRHARGRAVIVMDADFEHPPELIPKLIAAWRGGAKIVATQRSDDATVSSAKRLSSRLYYRVLDAIGDVRIEPGSADFMLLDRAVVDVINGLEDQDLFLRGLVRWLGFPLTTIPYARGTRRHGESSFSASRMVELALSGIAAHSVRPLRFAIWLALGFAALGLPVRDLRGGELPVRAAHRRGLVLDRRGDRDPRRRATARARHHRRICRAHLARDAQAPELHRGRDRGRAQHRKADRAGRP